MNPSRRDFFCFDSVLTASWTREVKLTGPTCQVLIALMSNSNKGGMVYMNQREIQVFLGCSAPTVKNGLATLMECGIVEKIDKKNGQYRITSRVGTKLS
jgi:Fe2+ or Zn2+ uptake regulation protein